MAKRPPDEKHQFGYGKAAFLFTSLSATGIFWCGGLASIYHGIDFVWHPPAEAIEYGWITYSTLAMSFLLDGAVLVGVLRELKQNHVPDGGSLMKTVRSLREPNVVAVMLEDFAATTGNCLFILIKKRIFFLGV